MFPSPSHLPSLILVAMFLLVMHVQALPPDVEKLIQSDQYAEALSRVDALLRETPNDAELLTLKSDLAKALQPKSAPENPAVSKLEMAEIRLIFNDALAQAEGSPERAKFMRELLEKTAPLVKRDDKAVDLWAMRGQAALELSLSLEGNDAATHLMGLGALESDNESLVTLLASLKRKGWLKPREQMVEEQKVEEQRITKQKEKKLAAGREATEAKRKELLKELEKHRNQWEIYVKSADRQMQMGNQSRMEYYDDLSREQAAEMERIENELRRLK